MSFDYLWTKTIVGITIIILAIDVMYFLVNDENESLRKIYRWLALFFFICDVSLIIIFFNL